MRTTTPTHSTPIAVKKDFTTTISRNQFFFKARESPVDCLISTIKILLTQIEMVSPIPEEGSVSSMNAASMNSCSHR